MQKQYQLEDFLNIKNSFGVTVAPDNKSAVYLNNDTGTLQLYLLNLVNQRVEKLTDFEDYIGLVEYSPTTNQIIFLKSEGGNENNQIFLMDLKTRKIKNLTNNPEVRFGWGAWSKDGNQITYYSNQRNGTDFDVYVLDLASNKSKMVFGQGSWCVPVCFSLSGRYLVISQELSNVNNDLFLVDLKTKKAKQITNHTKEAIFGTPQWLPDESGFFVRSNQNQEFLGLMFYTLANQKLDYVLNLDWDIDGAAISKNGKLLAIIINEGGYGRLKILNSSNLQQIKHPPFPLGEISELEWSQDSSTLYFSYSGSTKNWNSWRWQKKSNKIKQLTKSFNPIPEKTFVEPRLIYYNSFDKLKIGAFIYLPKGQTKKPAAIINIHGGPEGQYTPSFAALTQYLVYQGFAVIAPNVRGSSGYGKKFLTLDNIEKRLDSVKDLESLYKYLESEKLVDIKSIALMGGSYGGYMVLAGLCFYPNLWAAGVDTVGIANLVTFLENTAPYRRKLREAEYGFLDHDRKLLEEISPINHVDQIKAPLFIIHGANDPRVPLSEAEQIEKRLKELGQEVELLVYPDEGHGLAKLKNRLDAYPKVVKFLNKHLK